MILTHILFVILVLTLTGVLVTDNVLANPSADISEISNPIKISDSNLNDLNIPFIENIGQTDATVKFFANTFAGTIFVTESDLTYSLSSSISEKADNTLGIVIKEKFTNSQLLKPIGLTKSDTVVNYFIGNSDDWKTNISTFDVISLGEVWPLINIHLSSNANNVEKIFIVNPGAVIDDIQVEFDGIEQLSVNNDGQLEIQTELGILYMTSPIAFQEINGLKNYVDVYYVVDNVRYGFMINESQYNPNLPLIIDPLLASTFVGGSGIANDLIIDTSDNVFVVGSVGGDVLVSKFSNDLSSLISSTFIGGSQFDSGYAVAMDSADNLIITGITLSSDFPTTVGAALTSPPILGTNLFALKITNNLSSVISSTYLSPPSFTNDINIALDSLDNVFVVSDKIIVQKLSNDFTTILASVVLDPLSNVTVVYGIDIDSVGNVYLTGSTNPTSNLPTTLPPFGSISGNNAFVMKLSNSLSILDSVLIGGSVNAHSRGIIIDGSGDVVITGGTSSSDFPVTMGTYNGNGDAFVTKLTPDLTAIIASTFIGGSFGDTSNDIILDNSNNILITGFTNSLDYPVTSGSIGSSISAMITKLTPDLTTTLASTFIGGNIDDRATSIQVDTSNSIFIAGRTFSSDYPTTIGAFNTIFAGISDGFITKIDSDLILPPNPQTFPTIKITKNATNANGSFDFVITNATNINNSTSLSIPNTVTNNMTSPLTVPPGNYDVTEIVPSGWTLDSSDCEINGVSIGTTLNFAISFGDYVECIFKNTSLIPFSVPCGYDTNPNLYVSTENVATSNVFGGPMVTHVIVCDSDILDIFTEKGEPDVVVNGIALRMAQDNTGLWHGYFADKTQAQLADQSAIPSGPGIDLDLGYFCSNLSAIPIASSAFLDTVGIALPVTTTASGSQGTTPLSLCSGVVTSSNHNNVVNGFATLNPGTSLFTGIGQISITDDALWPFVQLYDFVEGGTALVQYHKGSGVQTATLTFDSSDPTVDSDGDGIADIVDTDPTNPSLAFSDIPLGWTTFGSITSLGDQTLTIVDELSVNGVIISARSNGGATDATISDCTSALLTFPASASFLLACASSDVKVIQGPVGVEYFIDGTSFASTTLQTGDDVIFEEDTLTFTNTGLFPIVLTLTNGIEITINVGETVVLSGDVTLCHKDRKTITISSEDVNDHLGHGDKLGECEDNDKKDKQGKGHGKHEDKEKGKGHEKFDDNKNDD